MKKSYLLIFILTFIFVFSGCTSGKFEEVPPPVKEFATPVPYEETEIISGFFKIEKSFYGNKVGNSLRVTSDAQTIKDFKIGDIGIISYVFEGSTYMFEGVMTSCPLEGSGDFIATHDSDASKIPETFPGRFSVVTYEKEDCTLIAKNAVLLLDDSGNACVLQIDEKGILQEKRIVVGYCNDTHYQVVSGINVGEKVVLR